MSTVKLTLMAPFLRAYQTMRTSLWSELRRTSRSYVDVPDKTGSLSWIECAKQKAGKILSGLLKSRVDPFRIAPPGIAPISFSYIGIILQFCILISKLYAHFQINVDFVQRDVD